MNPYTKNWSKAPERVEAHLRRELEIEKIVWVIFIIGVWSGLQCVYEYVKNGMNPAVIILFIPFFTFSLGCFLYSYAKDEKARKKLNL